MAWTPLHGTCSTPLAASTQLCGLSHTTPASTCKDGRGGGRARLWPDAPLEHLGPGRYNHQPPRVRQGFLEHGWPGAPSER